MNAPWPIVALISLLGLMIGSFLNVVIYRVPREESIFFPNSHCPRCQTSIKPWHNVPVLSWLLLRGKCASCHTRISVRYPLVEFGTAVLFGVTTLRFGLSMQLPAYLYLAAIGVALALIDFDVRRLPDSIVLPSYVIAVLLLMPAGAAQTNWWGAERSLIGMATLLAVYFALALAYPRGMDFGEVKLAGLLGLYLGWLGWGSVLIGVFGGFLISGASGAALIATHRVGRQTAIAFGPSMIAATVLTLFVAIPITDWYGSLLTVA